MVLIDNHQDRDQIMIKRQSPYKGLGMTDMSGLAGIPGISGAAATSAVGTDFLQALEFLDGAYALIKRLSVVVRV